MCKKRTNGMLLGVALFATLTALSAKAAVHNPPTCTSPGTTVLLTEFWDVDGSGTINAGDLPVTGVTKFIGQKLLITATLTQSGTTQCGYSGGTVTLTTPDGVVHTVASPVTTVVPLICGDLTCNPAGVASIDFGPVAYTVSAADMGRFGDGCINQVPDPTQAIRTAVDYSGGVDFCSSSSSCLAFGGASSCSPVENPCITCTKSCDYASGTGGADCFNYGTAVFFTGTVHNCGNVTLVNVIVTDDKAGAVTTIQTLAPDETATFSGSYTPTANLCGPLDDLVTVNATTESLQRPVEPTTCPASCNVCNNPCVGLVKDCSTITPPSPLNASSSEQTYTVSGHVNNCGNVPLVNVHVTDTITFTPADGSPPTTTTVDVLVNGTLALQETLPLSVTITVPANFCGTIKDHFSVTADSICGGAATPVTTPDCTVTVTCPPEIQVVKEVVCADPNVPDPVCDDTLTYADSAAGVVGSAGGTRSFCYKYTITNTGQDVLENVTLTDDVIGSITLPPAGLTLDPGESTVAFASHSAPVGDNQVNTATASGHGVSSNTDVTDQDTAVVSVAYIAVECELQLSSLDDQDNNPTDANLILPTSFAGSCVGGGAILTVRNTGQLTESVQVTESSTGVTVNGCVDSNGDPVDLSAPFDLDPGAEVTIHCDICDITCPGPDNISISVVGSAIGNETYPCILDAEGNPVTTASDSCPGTVSCVQPTECRTTGGGTLYAGDSNDNCVTVTTTLFPTSQNGLVLDHVSHGGQLGAPLANKDCAVFLADPCIRGQWQHTRHYQGKGNPRHTIESDFHSNTPKGIFDTLKCECLGCCPNEDGNSKKGPNGNFTGWDNFKFDVCNQDDHRVCGPVPRPSPANALIWSGVGTAKFITDTTTAGQANKTAEWMIIRVYVEDRSEPGGFHPKGSIDPSDVYVYQAWRTGVLVEKKGDPNSDAVLNALMPGQPAGGTLTIKQFRAALSSDSCAFLSAVSKTGTCPPGTLPPTAVAGIGAAVYDQGPLHDGNRQIHPVTGATCTAGPGIPVNFDYPHATGPYCVD